MLKLIIHTDGGSRGNPGPAATGVYITNEKQEVVFEEGRYLGRMTNNQAEYRALVDALGHAERLGASEVACFLDSELIVKQMKHEYKVKDAGLAELFLKVSNLLTKFKKYSFTHVRREFNKDADRLVNEALDRR